MIRDCCCLCFTFGWRPAGFALLRVLPVFGLIPHIFWVSFAVCDLPWGDSELQDLHFWQYLHFWHFFLDWAHGLFLGLADLSVTLSCTGP